MPALALDRLACDGSGQADNIRVANRDCVAIDCHRKNLVEEPICRYVDVRGPRTTSYIEGDSDNVGEVLVGRIPPDAIPLSVEILSNTVAGDT